MTMEIDTLDSDIYDNLLFDENILEEEVEKLQQQNKQLLEHIQSLESDIQKLCLKITDMKKTQDNLAKNISELFKTAKAEIERKDKVIAELRGQVDHCVCHKRTNPAPFKRVRTESPSLQRSDSGSLAKRVKTENYRENRERPKLVSNLQKSKSRSRSREKFKHSHRERSRDRPKKEYKNDKSRKCDYEMDKHRTVVREHSAKTSSCGFKDHDGYEQNTKKKVVNSIKSSKEKQKENLSVTCNNSNKKIVGDNCAQMVQGKIANQEKPEQRNASDHVQTTKTLPIPAVKINKNSKIGIQIVQDTRIKQSLEITTIIKEQSPDLKLQNKDSMNLIKSINIDKDELNKKGENISPVNSAIQKNNINDLSRINQKLKSLKGSKPSKIEDVADKLKKQHDNEQDVPLNLSTEINSAPISENKKNNAPVEENKKIDDEVLHKATKDTTNNRLSQWNDSFINPPNNAENSLDVCKSQINKDTNNGSNPTSTEISMKQGDPKATIVIDSDKENRKLEEKDITKVILSPKASIKETLKDCKQVDQELTLKQLSSKLSTDSQNIEKAPEPTGNDKIIEGKPSKGHKDLIKMANSEKTNLQGNVTQHKETTIKVTIDKNAKKMCNTDKHQSPKVDKKPKENVKNETTNATINTADIKIRNASTEKKCINLNHVKNSSSEDIKKLDTNNLSSEKPKHNSNKEDEVKRDKVVVKDPKENMKSEKTKTTITNTPDMTKIRKPSTEKNDAKLNVVNKPSSDEIKNLDASNNLKSEEVKDTTKKGLNVVNKPSSDEIKNLDASNDLKFEEAKDTTKKEEKAKTDKHEKKQEENNDLKDGGSKKEVRKRTASVDKKEKCESEKRVLRSATRNSRDKSNEERKKKENDINKSIQQGTNANKLYLDSCVLLNNSGDVNLTHEGDIPVLHITENENFQNNSNRGLFDVNLKTGNGPSVVASSSFIDILKEDLNISGLDQSIVENANKIHSQITESPLHRKSSVNTSITTPPNNISGDQKVLGTFSMKKRRRVIVTVID